MLSRVAYYACLNKQEDPLIPYDLELLGEAIPFWLRAGAPKMADGSSLAKIMGCVLTSLDRTLKSYHLVSAHRANPDLMGR